MGTTSQRRTEAFIKFAESVGRPVPVVADLPVREGDAIGKALLARYKRLLSISERLRLFRAAGLVGDLLNGADYDDLSHRVSHELHDLGWRLRLLVNP